MGKHDRLGVAGRAAGGEDQGIAIGHGLLGASRGQDALAGGRWQAGVERHDGVAFIPGASQPVDELAGAPRLDHDQPAHGGGGYGRRRRSTVDGIDAPDTTSEATIRTQALTKVYDAVPGGPAETSYLTAPAVDALDLEVGRGELFGLLGPNGAGKTTTIGMLTTRVVPTGGRAFVDGIDVVAEPARAKEHIGVVTQTNTLTFLPLAAVLGASLGLTVGTRVEPRQVPLVFSLLVLPMTFLGAVYYPWTSLEPLPWLRWAVLVNPLVYLSEGVRMGLTGDTIPHMNGVVIYAACIAFTAVLLWVGIQGFRRRVLS